MKESNFKLVNNKLTKLLFDINKNYNEPQSQLKYNIAVTPLKDETENKAIVVLMIKIFNRENFEKYPFYLEAELEGYFEWTDEIKEIDRYLKVNAPAVLLPFLRSIVFQIPVFAGYSPLIIPLINFQD